ncbi:hypothetical protein C2L89_01830 [Coxiella burnetii]|nr:hypothetical protein C2L89_01830 [Coxiella burnetii]
MSHVCKTADDSIDKPLDYRIDGVQIKLLNQTCISQIAIDKRIIDSAFKMFEKHHCQSFFISLIDATSQKVKSYENLKDLLTMSASNYKIQIHNIIDTLMNSIERQISKATSIKHLRLSSLTADDSFLTYLSNNLEFSSLLVTFHEEMYARLVKRAVKIVKTNELSTLEIEGITSKEGFYLQMRMLYSVEPQLLNEMNIYVHFQEGKYILSFTENGVLLEPVVQHSASQSSSNSISSSSSSGSGDNKRYTSDQPHFESKQTGADEYAQNIEPDLRKKLDVAVKRVESSLVVIKEKSKFHTTKLVVESRRGF